MNSFTLTTPLAVSGLSAGLISAAGLLATPAQAICLNGSLETVGNNCVTFNNTGASTATLRFRDDGLNSDQFLQLGFASSDLGTIPPPTQSSGFSVSNIEYSLDDVNYLPFGTGSASQAISNNNGGSSLTPLYTSAFQLPTPLPLSGASLYIRYTLPSTITTDGQVIGVYLRSNTNGAISPSTDPLGTPLLSTVSGVGGTLLTRDHTLSLPTPPPVSDVPGPLPLMGAAAAFRVSRRLRRRISAKA